MIIGRPLKFRDGFLVMGFGVLVDLAIERGDLQLEFFFVGLFDENLLLKFLEVLSCKHELVVLELLVQGLYQFAVL